MGKKSKIFSAALGVFVSMAAFAVEGEVTAALLNVRLRPELKSPVVLKLQKGDKVEVVAEAGEFLQIEAPADTPVFVSEVYLKDGKVTSEVNMRAGMDSAAPSLGLLQPGTSVTVERVSQHNWAKIKPPAGIRLYVARAYLRVAGVVPKAVVKAPEAKPEVKAEAKPEAKVEAKAPEAKVEAKAPEAKPEVKAEAKPEAKVEAKAPEAKPEVKVEAKPEVKVEATETKSKIDKIDAELARIGIDLGKGAAATASGHLVALPASGTSAAAYALMKSERENSYFVCAADGVDLKAAADQNVELQGVAYSVPGWKKPILKVTKVSVKK